MNKKTFPKKRFGQNFLTDFHYLKRLVSLLRLKKNDHIVEIGPGKGALTQHALPLVFRYDAIEIDRDLVPFLEKNFGHFLTFFLHNVDALKFNFTNLHLGQPMRLIGNLPYNISSPLLFHLFSANHLIQDMHFMLQFEVAKRIVAKPNTSEYGRLSVMTQYFCHTKLLLKVPSEAFTPKPKVLSAFVLLIPKAKQMMNAQNEAVLSAVVKEAFTYRRKTLGNSLKKYISTNQLTALEIDSMRRAQTLSVDEFVKIANSIS